MLKRSTKLLAITIVTYTLIELVCFVFIKFGYVKAKLPDFKYSYTLTEYPFPIADIDSIWGTWHYPEHFLREENCLKFNYHINSWGARDIERSLHHKDSNRVIVLGDSFMEGYGMAEGKRLSNQLEKNTNRQFLNFSCTNFGTTQELLLYQNLASKFDHSTLLIGILPYNDFEDNDTSLHMNPYYKRFRPYYKGIAPNYHLVYCEDSIQKTNFNKQGFFKKENSPKARITRFFRAYTCWFNIITFFLDYDIVSHQKQTLGSYQYRREQWEKMCFILQNIKKAADHRRIIVITIPTSADIKKFRLSGQPPLKEAMDSFCRINNMEYVDLLPLFASRPHSEDEFYFTCDPHWNEAGNTFAAEQLKHLFIEPDHRKSSN